MIGGLRSLCSCSAASSSLVISRSAPRFALGCGLLLIAALFVLEMSGSAPRMAGSDRIADPVFAATVPGGGVLCQAVQPPPSDTARVQLLAASNGHPLPPLQFRFLSAAGQDVADGDVAVPGPQSRVTIALTRRGDWASITRACLHVGGRTPVMIGGEQTPAGTVVVDGKHQPAVLGLVYLRRGSESWWQLLPTLARRFGLGKASLFGTWTLPVLALGFVALSAATIRLLWRELA